VAAQGAGLEGGGSGIGEGDVVHKVVAAVRDAHHHALHMGGEGQLAAQARRLAATVRQIQHILRTAAPRQLPRLHALQHGQAERRGRCTPPAQAQASLSQPRRSSLRSYLLCLVGRAHNVEGIRMENDVTGGARHHPAAGALDVFAQRFCAHALPVLSHVAQGHALEPLALKLIVCVRHLTCGQRAQRRSSGARS